MKENAKERKRECAEAVLAWLAENPLAALPA